MDESLLSIASAEERASVLAKLWRYVTKRKKSIEENAARKFNHLGETHKPKDRLDPKHGHGPKHGSPNTHGNQCRCGSSSCSGSLVMQYTIAMETGDDEKCRMIREGRWPPPVQEETLPQASSQDKEQGNTDTGSQPQGPKTSTATSAKFSGSPAKTGSQTHGYLCRCGSSSCSGSVVMQYTIAMEKGDVEKCRMIREGRFPTVDAKETDDGGGGGGGDKMETSVSVDSISDPFSLETSAEIMETSKEVKEPTTKKLKNSKIPIRDLATHQPPMAGIPQLGIKPWSSHVFSLPGFLSSNSQNEDKHRLLSKTNVVESELMDDSAATEWLHDNIHNLHTMTLAEQENLQNHVALKKNPDIEKSLAYVKAKHNAEDSSGTHHHAPAKDAKKKRFRRFSTSSLRHFVSSKKQYKYQKVKNHHRNVKSSGRSRTLSV